MARKYIHIQDIRACKCYANVNARLLYLHVACQVDLSSYTCAKSLRQLGRELDMSLGEVRHALSQLIEDGLVSTYTAAHSTAQRYAHPTTQPTTHLHIVKANEIHDASNDASNTANDIANDIANDTQNKIYNNNYEELALTLERARECEKKLTEVIAAQLRLTHQTASEMVAAFFSRKELEGKRWKNLDDLTAHAVAWSEKRVQLVKVKPLPEPDAIRTDHAARMAEKKRTDEVASAETIDEKKEAEKRKLYGWIRDAQKNKRTELVKQFTEALETIDEWFGK
jgi:hypothetical protein